MRNFDFKRYTPRPKKLLRASLNTYFKYYWKSEDKPEMFYSNQVEFSVSKLLLTFSNPVISNMDWFGGDVNLTFNLYQLYFYDFDECDEESYTSLYSRAYQRAREVSISVESFLGFVSSKKIFIVRETW